MKKVLLVAPHPDDLEISASHLVIAARDVGLETVEVVLTDGRHGGLDVSRFGTPGLVAARKLECEDGARDLGVSAVHFLSFEDGSLLKNVGACLRRLADLFEPSDLALVVAPSEFDGHDDHVGAGRVARAFISQHHGTVDRPIIAEYSFWARVRSNVRVETPHCELKTMAIRHHKSQPVDRYIEMLSACGALDGEDFLVANGDAPRFVRILYPFARHLGDLT